MKLRIVGVLLLIGLMVSWANAVSSFHWEPNMVADWDDGDGFNWRDGSETGAVTTEPDSTAEVKIKDFYNDGDPTSGQQHSVVTVDTVVDWGGGLPLTKNGTRMRVYDSDKVGTGATLKIVENGDLAGFCWIRVGESSGGAGQVVQTGGRLMLRSYGAVEGGTTEKGKIAIGDGAGCTPGSTYTISGGTLTYKKVDEGAADGQLIVGARGGEGTFVVIGTAPVIDLKNLYIAGDGTDGETATLKYVFGSGVSAIQLDGSAYIDQGSTTTANLVFENVIAAPAADILLINATTTITGVFDFVTGDLNGGSGLEGDDVQLALNVYNLTYAGGTDGVDLVLEYLYTIPEPATIALLGLGLIAIRRRK